MKGTDGELAAVLQAAPDLSAFQHLVSFLVVLLYAVSCDEVLEQTLSVRGDGLSNSHLH